MTCSSCKAEKTLRENGMCADCAFMARMEEYLKTLAVEHRLDDDLVAYCATLRPASLMLTRLASELLRWRKGELRFKPPLPFPPVSLPDQVSPKPGSVEAVRESVPPRQVPAEGPPVSADFPTGGA